MIKMKKEEAWNKFKKSGKVEDYLVYASKKSVKNDNKGRRDYC